MATTTTTEYADIRLTESLGDQILAEARPKNIVTQLVNMYSIEGLPTRTKKLNRWNDPGRATTATEGTTFTTTTALGTTALSTTPTEQAVAMVLVTNDAVETRIPGVTSVAQLMQEGSFEQKFAAILPEASMVGRMCFEKLENDLTGLFASLNGGTAIGTSGSDMTLANFDAALLTLESVDGLPHDDIVASLDREQFGNLRTALMVTSGGVAGTIWSLDLASIVASRSLPPNGLKGALLGVPVYVHDVGVRQNANGTADVVGALFLRGVGAPEDGGGGQPGTFAMIEGRKLVFTIEADHRERAAEVQGNWKYSVVERIDAWGVPIVTDAP